MGRGAWAGPVVVGALVYGIESKLVRGVHDSKMVRRELREKIFAKLVTQEHLIVQAEVEEINRVGVGKAITRLIRSIVDAYSSPDNYFLIDGHFADKFCENSRQVIDGDKLHYSIAGASIIAKVYRDRLMRELAKSYRYYYFEDNVGYPTPKHLQALKERGVSQVHRKSFKPILEMQEQFSFNLK